MAKKEAQRGFTPSGGTSAGTASSPMVFGKAEALAKRKATSRCSDCKQLGHLHGDPERKAPRNRKKGSGVHFVDEDVSSVADAPQDMTYVALADFESAVLGRCRRFDDIADESNRMAALHHVH